MKIKHVNRNRGLMQKILFNRKDVEKVKPTRKYNLDLQIKKDPTYRQLKYNASYAPESKCNVCRISTLCSATSPTDYVVTPRYCKQAQKIVAELLLSKALPKIKLQEVKK